MKDAMDFFFFFSFPPSPVEEYEEGHLSFWKGSLFYKDHNMVCLTRPWPSDYLWCPHYVVHLVWLGEEEEEEKEKEREEGREEEWGGVSATYSYCYTESLYTFLLKHIQWHFMIQCMRSISDSTSVFQITSLVKKLKYLLCSPFNYLYMITLLKP